jgi:hypothetical protein
MLATINIASASAVPAPPKPYLFNFLRVISRTTPQIPLSHQKNPLAVGGSGCTFVSMTNWTVVGSVDALGVLAVTTGSPG